MTSHLVAVEGSQVPPALAIHPGGSKAGLPCRRQPLVPANQGFASMLHQMFLERLKIMYDETGPSKIVVPEGWVV